MNAGRATLMPGGKCDFMEATIEIFHRQFPWFVQRFQAIGMVVGSSNFFRSVYLFLIFSFINTGSGRHMSIMGQTFLVLWRRIAFVFQVSFSFYLVIALYSVIILWKSYLLHSPAYSKVHLFSLKKGNLNWNRNICSCYTEHKTEKKKE